MDGAVGLFVLAPFHLVHDLGLGLAANLDMPQANEVHAVGRTLAGNHRLRGPHLGAAGKIAQPRGHIHGVAIAVAIDLDHLAAGEAYMDFHALRRGLG